MCRARPDRAGAGGRPADACLFIENTFEMPGNGLGQIFCARGPGKGRLGPAHHRQSGTNDTTGRCKKDRASPKRRVRQSPPCPRKEIAMHSIIYLVGLVVIIMAILSFVGIA